MLHRHPDLAALARAVADELPALLGTGSHVALPGGNTPKALFAELVSRGRDFLPWDGITVWWGDERCVPPDHADSNFGMAKRTLLDPLRLRTYHRIEGELDPHDAARRYETLVRDVQLDVVLLGIGADGHTASIFPDTVLDPDHLVTSTLAPSGQPRVTMTPSLINKARHVRFLVAGADKAGALAGIVNNKGNYPAKLIQGADVVWHVEEAVAKGTA